MALSPTNRFINPSSVSFTPSGGTLTAIKGVKSIGINPNVQVLKESGDADFFNTFAGAVSADWVIDVQFINTMSLNSVTPGVIGTFTFTINDARNGAVTGGGAMIYTISNAVYDPGNMSNPHRQMSTASAQFHTYSTDGTTSAVAVAAA